MTPTKRSSLGIARADSDGKPLWALVGEGALATMKFDRITTSELEALPFDQRDAEARVDHVMEALEAYGADLARTPGGAGWLYVQHVPARRLVAQVVRKLAALSAWKPFAKAPGPLRLAPYEGLVGLRSSSSREYRAYTVTWSGIAYLLGAAAPHNPLRSAQLRNLPPAATAASVPSPAPSELPVSEVVALSWSSRHAATLLPVLEELARNGRTSLVVDLATDPAERCPASGVAGVNLCSPPPSLFDLSGAVDGLRPQDDGPVVRVDEHEVQLARFLRLVSVLLETSGGCTQPSWRSVVRAETWLDGVLAAARPHTVLVSNDTSPLGALAVHVAERHGVNTVHVQHGAWTAESVAWPALHSRDIVVMGERDLPLAKEWVRHPDAEVQSWASPASMYSLASAAIASGATWKVCWLPACVAVLPASRCGPASPSVLTGSRPRPTSSWTVCGGPAATGASSSRPTRHRASTSSPPCSNGTVGRSWPWPTPGSAPVAASPVPTPWRAPIRRAASKPR
ncbi:hypothetical protein [Streptomyces pseudogriseolus]|uniref:hypothetical protein n=1 Tax=Streptomyces pseudogriseolus TaxID=36817 RepID=UPI003FA2DE5F